jgi:filamentous hemagglutinin family protein
MTKSWQYLQLALILALGRTFATATSVLAQSITLDGTLAPVRPLSGPDYTIRQEDGLSVGNNLFQSFGRFNLNPGESANFQSTPNIRNILSRVTGGSRSLIDGLISTNSANVNLFFINPSGIVFGPNASLNVGGSFVASTANALQFGNLGFFSATDKNIPSPLLTINPSALLFNQINQNAAIENNSVAPAGTDPAGFDAFGLRVPDGKSLMLVGGNVSMVGDN